MKPKFLPRENEPVLQPEPVADIPKAVESEKEEGKYKWSGKWPRPLGKAEE
jgi:hypothetical protein